MNQEFDESAQDAMVVNPFAKTESPVIENGNINNAKDEVDPFSSILSVPECIEEVKFNKKSFNY